MKYQKWQTHLKSVCKSKPALKTFDHLELVTEGSGHIDTIIASASMTTIINYFRNKLKLLPIHEGGYVFPYHSGYYLGMRVATLCWFTIDRMTSPVSLNILVLQSSATLPTILLCSNISVVQNLIWSLAIFLPKACSQLAQYYYDFSVSVIWLCG